MTDNPQRAMHLTMLPYLPLIAGLLPLTAAYLAFGIGVLAETLPPCVPFIDGCASISATGRKPPGSFLFRAVMLPQATLLLFTWYFAVAWLRSLDSELSVRVRYAIHMSSIASVLALVLYVTFLGTREPFYEFMRRFGIYLFFLGMVLVEIFVATAARRIARRLRHGRLEQLAKVMLVLCLAPFVLGVLDLYLKATLAEPDAAENVIEWIAATLMHIYLVMLFLAWRMTGFDLSVTTATPDP